MYFHIRIIWVDGLGPRPNNEGVASVGCGEERAESKGKTLGLLACGH